MKRFLNGACLAAGLGAAAWVAITHGGSYPAVLPMLALIVAAFLAGALELRRYGADTQALLTELARAQEQAPEQAEPWLSALPETLRSAVRQRMQGDRVALPGPALTPTLTGLLVLLGLLGTFIGMVASLSGTVAALGASADLQAVRQALAAPVQGLGLAFGTSVAGVAASASLGLMSALARSDRTRASRALDTALATVLHPLTEDHRRVLMLRALQASAEQGRWLPEVAQRIESALAQVAEDSRATGQALAQGLREAARDSAQQTRAWVEPVIDGALSRLLDRVAQSQVTITQGMLHMQSAWSQALEQTNNRLLQTAEAAQQRMASAQAQLESGGERLHAQLLAQTEQSQEVLREQFLEQTSQALSAFAAREREQLAERERLLGDVGTLMQALQHAATQQRQALDDLLDSAAQSLTASTVRFDAQTSQVATTLSAATDQAAAASQALALVGEQFEKSVQHFGGVHQALGEQLARVEAALGQHLARSDEQLAYYVAQAREVIELTLGAQAQLVEDLRRVWRHAAAEQPLMSAA